MKREDAETLVEEMVAFGQAGNEKEYNARWGKIIAALTTPDPEPQGVTMEQFVESLGKTAERLLEPQGEWAPGLTMKALREANSTRQAEWDPSDQITLEFRGNELAGEVGEACNVIKKLARERLGIAGSRDTKEHLAEELADVVICADLIGMTAGINLADAVVHKFNASSEKVGLKTRLAAAPRPEPAADDVALVDALQTAFGDDWGRGRTALLSRLAELRARAEKAEAALQASRALADKDTKS